MPVLERQVRRLRLKAAHEDHVRHGQVLLEDALRTATLGDEARLIIVRRLDLGVVSSRANSTHWSRRIEESFRKTNLVPVSVHAPSAPYAAAVYFVDHNEPWLQLARRTLAEQPCTEWYWRSALPGWKPSAPAAETLRLCVRTLALRGGLPLTLRLFATLPSTAIDTLLQTLEPSDLAPLRAALDCPFNAPDVKTLLAAEKSSALSPNDLERRLIQLWGPTDIRTNFLAAIRLSLDNSSGSSLFGNSVVSSSRIQQLVRHWRSENYSSVADRSIPATKSADTTSIRSPQRSVISPLEETLASETEPPISLERLFTRAGGLFFLISLLDHAGLPDFLTTLPEPARAEFPWQILRLALRHARVDAADPLTVVFDELPSTDQPLGRWLLAVNRRALRLTGMNLRAIVRRPARITLTPTHVDVFFRPAEAEVRLRRAGLDLDPGWIPWLGRAVAYHFNRED
ncbi:MAG: hypothetical protein QM715_19800 [Nibricoccus sp.]